MNELEYAAQNFILWIPTIVVFIESVILPILMKISENKQKATLTNMEEKLKEIVDTNKALKLENVVLKRKLNHLLTKMDHIHREPEED